MADTFYDPKKDEEYRKALEKLEAAGCRDGDTVSIYDFEFDFVK